MRVVIGALSDNPALVGGTIGFAVGLAAGLGVAFRGWLAARSKRRELEEQARDLKSHLHRQMEITGEGNRALRDELEELRKQNENLRITVRTLQNKPDRSELRTLHVYDRAVHILNVEAPGFAPAWERAVEKAEQEVQETETGLRALVRRVFRSALPSGDAEPAQESSAEQE